MSDLPSFSSKDLEKALMKLGFTVGFSKEQLLEALKNA